MKYLGNIPKCPKILFPGKILVQNLAWKIPNECLFPFLVCFMLIFFYDDHNTRYDLLDQEKFAPFDGNFVRTERICHLGFRQIWSRGSNQRFELVSVKAVQFVRLRRCQSMQPCSLGLSEFQNCRKAKLVTYTPV